MGIISDDFEKHRALFRESFQEVYGDVLAGGAPAPICATDTKHKEFTARAQGVVPSKLADTDSIATAFRRPVQVPRQRGCAMGYGFSFRFP